MSTIKPTLGIIAVAKKNHNQIEIKESLKSCKTRLLNDDRLRLLIEENILYDERVIIETANKLVNEGVDAILFVVGTWIYSSIIISAVNNLTVPFIIYGLSDCYANGNLGASLQIKYVLNEMGKKFLYLFGKMEDEDNYTKIIKYSMAAWVKKSMRNKKIASIGGKCMMMYQTQVNEFDWKKVFGVDFPQYDSVQVFKEMENVDDKEAEAIAEDFLSKVRKVNWKLESNEVIYPDAIVSQAKLFLAFKRLKELYGIDIFANKCFPEMASPIYGYGYCACIATSMLNEDGITTACEADIPAALSMYILKLLSGQQVFFADIAKADKVDNRVTFFNCGTAPISMADKNGVELWPIPSCLADEAVPDAYYTNKVKGACIGFTLEEGREVTLLRIGGNGDTLRLHTVKAITAKRDFDPDGANAVRWPGFGIKLENHSIADFFDNVTGHHYSLVFGDYIEELKYLAEILGIRFICND